MTENTQFLDSQYFDRPTCAFLAYPSTVAMVDGTGSSDESNWLIASKRNNGAYQPKGTIFLDSHCIVNGPRVPFWHLLHRGNGPRVPFWHLASSSTVAGVDGTSQVEK